MMAQGGGTRQEVFRWYAQPLPRHASGLIVQRPSGIFTQHGAVQVKAAIHSEI
jgi:hypothetical protein